MSTSPAVSCGQESLLSSATELVLPEDVIAWKVGSETGFINGADVLWCYLEKIQDLVSWTGVRDC